MLSASEQPSECQNKTIFTAFLVSFFTSLPPGITNVMTIRLAMAGDNKSAILFSFGLLIPEIIYAKICVRLMSRMTRFKLVTKYLQWLSLIMLLAMGISSFITSPTENIQLTDGIFMNLPPFILGFILMAMNPVQVPFWFAWTTILTERKILNPGKQDDNKYLIGVGLGSAFASALFIAAGRSLLFFISISEHSMHFIFGCVFTALALINGWKLAVAKQSGKNSKPVGNSSIP